VSLLLPDGIDHIDDLPYTFHNALVQSLGFLAMEELPKDERPPRRIWMERDLMKDHFKRVEAARDAKYGTGSGDTKMSDQPLDGPETRNAAMDDLIR
jgi:hypothetical protein